MASEYALPTPRFTAGTVVEPSPIVAYVKSKLAITCPDVLSKLVPGSISTGDDVF